MYIFWHRTYIRLGLIYKVKELLPVESHFEVYPSPDFVHLQ